MPYRPALAEPDPPAFDHDGSTPHAALTPHAPTAPNNAPSTPPNPTTLTSLARAHRGWLLTVLRLRFGRDAAEDLAQETFLRAAGQPDLANLRHPKAWLLQVALNAARDQRRRRAARPPLTDADGALELPDTPTAADQDQALLLKQIVLSLPPQLKAVFLLSRFGGLTYQHFEAGRGRLNLARIQSFAEATDTDPFAILAAIAMDAPQFALRCADNKLMLILMMHLQDFDREVGDGIARLDARSVIAGLSHAFAGLRADAGRRDAFVEAWLARREEASGNLPPPDAAGGKT